MSSKNKRGAWIVPTDQVREFMGGPIDYNSLIMDCLTTKEQEKFKEALKLHKGAKRREPEEYPIFKY